MLYHRDIFLPDYITKIKATKIKLSYTQHAKNAALNDRYDKIILPDTLTVQSQDIIEVESWKDRIDKKIVIRIDYNK